MPNMDQIPTVTREQILQELAAIGFAKATDYWKVENDRLQVRPTQELDPRSAAAVASIEKTSGGLKLKLYDKLKALEMLGKHSGLFDVQAEPVKNNLLDAIVASTKEVMDTHDLPELQQAAADRHDLVESGAAEVL